MAEMETTATDQEGMDAVRMPWNVWPRTKVDASKCVIPLAASISPIHAHPEILNLPYGPILCRTCTSILNPFCRVDISNKIWICPFCFQRNHFPPSYSMIAEDNLPAELYPAYSTIQYSLPSNIPPNVDNSVYDTSPVFVFVLDTCLVEEELGFAKSALKQAIGLLPDNARVGFISFGTQVQVHELGFSDMSKVYVFRGSKEISKEQVLEQLGLASTGRRIAASVAGHAKGLQGGSANPGIGRFLLPAADCEYTLNSLLDELETNQWPIPPRNRACRCTGVALRVAASLLGACVKGTGGRIIALIGGPCTEGPGKIVSNDLSDPVRSHKDLDKDAVPFFRKAVNYFDNLAVQLVSQGHVLDLFASALDQVGVAEMKVTVERTGGLVVLAESFGHSVFKESFKRTFADGDGSLGLSFNGTLEINCSKDIKIQGIIGPCSSLEKKGPSVADTVIGEGNTTTWIMCGLDKNTCLTVFFDISTDEPLTPANQNPQLYIQFITNYQDTEGHPKIRVTTVSRCWVNDNGVGSEELVQGFDQETAAVVMARIASMKMEMEDEFNAPKWLDRSLIRLCSRFGDYRKDDPASFTLSPNFSLFPQLMFNLRRSQFFQVFNNSPDETAYFRMMLNRENISNAAVMIQPSLISYLLYSPPSPVLLDVASIAADRILLLDSYFSLVIFHGITVAQWRNMGYQNHPEQKAFAQMLQAPQDDAQMIIRERFPVPRLVVCDQHGSQARFLLAKLNPSATYNNVSEVEPGKDIIFTDDVNLQMFYEHLQMLAVQLS